MFARHLLALWAAVAILAGVVAFAVYQGQQRNEGVHTFVCFFEAAVLKAPQTPAKRASAIKFFDGVNAALRESNCPH